MVIYFLGVFIRRMLGDRKPFWRRQTLFELLDTANRRLADLELRNRMLEHDLHLAAHEGLWRYSNPLAAHAQYVNNKVEQFRIERGIKKSRLTGRAFSIGRHDHTQGRKRVVTAGPLEVELPQQ